MTDDQLIEAAGIIPDRFHQYTCRDEWGGFIFLMGKEESCIARVYWYDDRPDKIFLDWLNVNEPFRKNGIGTELQLIRENIGKILGAKTSMLWVRKDTWMQEWYERRGYVYHSVYAKENAIWMQKSLE